jgi:hypothetical protein
MFQDSSDSLGTRSLPGLDQSSPSLSVCSTTAELRRSASGRVSGYEKLPVSLSDVPFFNDDEDDGDQEFQCTLAIIKPEVAQLMYKVECIMAQNGFIIKTVCDTFFFQVHGDVFRRKNSVGNYLRCQILNPMLGR